MPDRVFTACADPLSHEDQALFARAYRQHYPALVSFARRRVGSDAEANDLVQEAYLRVLRYRDNQDAGSLKSLLFQIIANLLIERARLARSQRWAQHVPLDEEPALTGRAPSQDRHVAGEQALDRLLAVIRRLPRKCRQVFVLHRFHGMTRQAVADRLGISLKTVEKHLTTAAATCRRKLGSDWP